MVRKERVTLRLSNRDSRIISQIQKSGEFEDTSATIRWCISFTNTLLKIIPESIALSFLEAEEEVEEKSEPVS
jgi:hypothetical protein